MVLIPSARSLSLSLSLKPYALSLLAFPLPSSLFRVRALSFSFYLLISRVVFLPLCLSQACGISVFVFMSSWSVLDGLHCA